MPLILCRQRLDEPNGKNINSWVHLAVGKNSLGWKSFFAFFILWLITFPPSAAAQDFTRLPDGMPVERNGERLALPFYGGLDRFIPQFVDIDHDGDFDLFVSEADGQLTYLENGGTPQQHKFRLISDAYKNLNVQSWFYLADIDGDSDLDLYRANNDNGLAFHRNLGSRARPNFVLETTTVTTSDNQKILSQDTSIPVFADIDNDGDADFLTGVITGEIALYRNNGTSRAPAFVFETGKWQDLLIFSFGQAPGKSGPNRHGANALEFVDIDGDKDFDLFYGDFFHAGLYFLRNNGTANEAQIAITDTLFPRINPILSAGYNIPRFVDLDADNDKDLLMASLKQNQNNFIFLRKVTAVAAFPYQTITTNFLGTLDVGSNSAPALADIDADGDQDLLAGNIDGQIGFYENTGAATAPAFRWATDNLPGLQPNLHFSAAPALTDIDADGDLDLFVGNNFGKVVLYENKGTPRIPAFVLSAKEYGGINVGGWAAPCFVDLHKDGDADLYIGSAFGGVVHLYENVGTSNSARFQLKKQIRHAFNVDDVIPSLYDWTGDGILDLFAGERQGTVVYYRGVAPDSFVFAQKDFAGIDVGFWAAPLFADLNGDSHVDLLLGEGDGGVNFYQGDLGNAVQGPRNLPKAFALEIYPNPFLQQVNIALRLSEKINPPPRAVVFDLLGARIAEVEMKYTNDNQWRAAWPAANLDLPAAVYFVKVFWRNEQIIQKILLIR